MATVDHYEDRRRGGGGNAILVTLTILVFIGLAFSAAAYFFTEPHLSIGEALIGGFGGLAGLIVALFAGLFGLLIGLIGALFGIAVGAGAVGITLFFVASPIIAIILFVLLMRRPKCDCPDTDAGAHY